MGDCSDFMKFSGKTKRGEGQISDVDDGVEAKRVHRELSPVEVLENQPLIEE
jgi:hypothetical protein